MLGVHEELVILRKNLQLNDMPVSEVSPLIDATLGKLEYMKGHDGGGLTDMIQNVEERDDTVCYTGEKMKYYSEQSKSEFKALRERCLKSFIQKIHKRCRQEDSDILSSLSSVLDPNIVVASSSEEFETSVNLLSQHYGTDKNMNTVTGGLLDPECTEILTKVDPLIKEGVTRAILQSTGCRAS